MIFLLSNLRTQSSFLIVSEFCRGSYLISVNGNTWNTSVCPSTDVSGSPACSVNTSPAQPGQYVASCQYGGGISYRLGATPENWSMQSGDPIITYNNGDDSGCAAPRQLNIQLQCSPSIGPVQGQEKTSCNYWLVRCYVEISRMRLLTRLVADLEFTRRVPTYVIPLL